MNKLRELKNPKKPSETKNFAIKTGPARSHNSCPRCNGFIVPERLWDVQGTCDPLWVSAVRCTNCGFIVGSLSKPNPYKLPQRRPRRHRAQQVVPLRSDSSE